MAEPSAPESPEQAEFRIAEAVRAHERADRAEAGRFAATSTFAVEAIKAPALVNGGSAAAMLAFIGTGRQPVTADTILGLKFFAIGLLLAALATGATWIGQRRYFDQVGRAQRSWQHPFVVWHAPSGRWGDRLRNCSVALVLASYALACGGMWLVSRGLVPLPIR